MGKLAAREVEAARRDNGEGSSRSDGVAVRAWLTPRFRRRVEQWQKPPLQAWSRLARHDLLLRPVSSESLAAAQPHAPTRTPVLVSCCSTGLKARGLPAGCLPRARARMRTACGAACSTCKPPWPSCPRAKASWVATSSDRKLQLRVAGKRRRYFDFF